MRWKFSFQVGKSFNGALKLSKTATYAYSRGKVSLDDPYFTFQTILTFIFHSSGVTACIMYIEKKTFKNHTLYQGRFYILLALSRVQMPIFIKQFHWKQVGLGVVQRLFFSTVYGQTETTTPMKLQFELIFLKEAQPI